MSVEFETIAPAIVDSASPPDARSKALRDLPSRAKLALPSILLSGVRIHAIDEKRCISHILAELDNGYGGVVVTPNLDHLCRAVRDLEFQAMLSEADLVVADGMPLIWASRLQGTPLPQRVAGSNLISSLSAGAAEKGRSIYLLGGLPGAADAAAKVLRERHPSIKIAGTFCPRLGFEKSVKQMGEVASRLTEAKPDIVYVALGSPKQEELIFKLRHLLPTTWWLGVGISFSFLCGQVKRAPLWMQQYGVEWAHRLYQEPRRLFKRYVVDGLPFGVRLMGASATRGVMKKMGMAGDFPGGLDPGAVERINSQVMAGGFLRSTLAQSVVPVGAPGSNQTVSTTVEAVPAIPPTANVTNVQSTVTINDRLAMRAQRSAARLSQNSGLSRLKSLVLLGGQVRPTALSLSIGRSLLDLPLDDDGSVLNHWLSHAAELAKLAGLEKLPVRVMVDRNSPEPISAAVRYFGTFRVERDQSEYRGTGGVLADMAGNYEDEDLILVANAGQILLEPLVALATSLGQRANDITIVSHRDGTPSGMMLLACKTLRSIPSTGFIDLKEQAMPQIAQKFSVEVVHRRRPTGLPIRTLQDYLTAMRFYHLRRLSSTTLLDPLAEDWHPAFGIVEAGAIVDPTARIHDSVVLNGALVESGAVLVRSVLCPGAIVRKDRTVMDEFVGPPGGRIRPGTSSIVAPGGPSPQGPAPHGQGPQGAGPQGMDKSSGGDDWTPRDQAA